MPPPFPSKIGPNWAKSFEDSFVKLKIEGGGGYYAISLVKNAVKSQTFYFSEKITDFPLLIFRLPFLNANSEAGMWDVAAIQILSSVLLL